MTIQQHDRKVAASRATTVRPSIAKPPGYAYSYGAMVRSMHDSDEITFGAVVGYSQTGPDKVCYTAVYTVIHCIIYY
jgi:hypothetical protein